MSAFTFGVVAWRVARKGGVPARGETEGATAAAPAAHKSASLAFAALFFTEWADVGQLAAAGAAAGTGRPWLVWIAATGAMLTKVAAGLVLGLGLRRWVPAHIVRRVSVALCAAMAAASLVAAW